MKKFVVVTKDYSGLGWATKLQDEGNKVIVAYKPDPDEFKTDQDQEAFDLVGNGLITKFPLDNIMKKRKEMKDWYWIWDANQNVPEAETLKKEGFKVFEGGKFNDQMEHDRDFALKFAKKYGLESPASFPFTDAKQAIAFLEQNEETAYVFKPDSGESYETWLPESESSADANLELRVHLQSLQKKEPFILQERKNGVETNVEVWFMKGEPVFAFMCIESKRKLNDDLGEFVGCGFDFTFTIPLTCQAVQNSIGKMFPAYKEMNFTGMVDANFIVAKDNYYYFESCNRFGYNSHPNLLLTLNLDPLGKTIASLLDGTFKPNFTKGFGSSVTMYTDHPRIGKAIQFPEKFYPSLFFWDVYKEGDIFMTAGFDNSVLVVTAFGYTIPTAWENVMEKAHKIKFPGRSYRTDGDKTNFATSPIRRYEALKIMGVLD